MVTARLDLDPSSRLIAAAPPSARTIVITTAQAPADRRAALDGLAEVIVAGQETVDLKAAVAALAERGHRRMLAEGGPRLLTQIAAAGLLDEPCLTIGPLLAGPGADRILAGARYQGQGHSCSPWPTSWRTTAACSAGTSGEIIYSERNVVSAARNAKAYKIVHTQNGALWEAAMRLRRHRRHLVVWTQFALADPYGGPRGLRLARARPVRRRIRTVTLLTIVALMPLARAVRARWRPLLAGAALTAAGVILRGSTAGSVILLPGLLLLLSAPLLPGTPEANRLQRSELERQLSVYSTPAQRRDLEATLDQYPDPVTHELRDILTRQAVATAAGPRIPGGGTG